MDKAALRSLQRSRTLTGGERARQSGRLVERLLPLLETTRAVALFVGRGHEPDTAALFEALAPRGRWLPKVMGPAALAWGLLERWDRLVPGVFGLLEPPQTSHGALPEEVDVVLVPGLAFDRSGGRLGQGRGYYDRALAATAAVRVGLCLTPGLVDCVPMAPHDLYMHKVVTPDAVHLGENARAQGQ